MKTEKLYRPHMCEHANEVPMTCPCAAGCYCRSHTCKSQRSRCSGTDRYQCLTMPKCLGGKGCDECWSKFRSPPKYSLAWLRSYRAQVFARMQGLATAKVESKALKAARRKLARLMAEVSKLSAFVGESCPHLIEEQAYEERGREDTLGNYKSGRSCSIRCKGCGVFLARWSESGPG